MPVYELQDAAGGTGDGEKKVYPVIPEDTILEARITAIKEAVKPYKDDDGNEVVRLEWSFLITSGEYEKRRLWGETGIKFVNHPDCKLFGWTQGALGTEVPSGFVCNTDDLVGLNVRVVVGERTYTKKGETDPTTVNNVKDVFPAKTSGAVGFNDPF